MDFSGVQSQAFGNAFVDHKTTTLDYSGTEEPPFLIPLLCDPTDWTLSTAQPWQQSPFTESSVSLSTNGGVYSDASWNPFDQSFATGQISPGFEYKTESTYGAQSSGSDGNEEFVNLTDAEERGYNGEQMKLEVPPAEPHHIFYRPLPRHPKSASKPKPKPKSKTKRSPKLSPTASAATPAYPYPSTYPHRKHTLSPLPPSRISASPPSLHSPTSPTTQNTNKIKTSRNKVEKQYRNRLNDEFQSLLQVLPQDSMRVEWKKSVGARVSKAEVLVLARERIGELEEEGWSLEREKEILLEKLEEMKRRALEMGDLKGVGAGASGMKTSTSLSS